jgi:hypothetical protein
MQLSRGRSHCVRWHLALVVVSLVFCFCVLPSNASPDHLLPQQRSHVEEMMRPPELEEESSKRVAGQRLRRKKKSDKKGKVEDTKEKGTNKVTSNKTKGTKGKKAENGNKEAKQAKHSAAKFEQESVPVDFDSFFEETMMSMPTQVRQEKSRRPICDDDQKSSHNSYLLWM